MKNTPFSIAILAGGQSRRMGQNKALIPIGGISTLQRVISVVTALTDDLFLVTNTPQSYQAFALPIVTDLQPGKGSLGGLYTALASSRHPWTLVLACDMPLLRADVITFLATCRVQTEVVIPQIDSFMEPLHAFYHQTCLAPIGRQLTGTDLKIIRFFDLVRVNFVTKQDFSSVTTDFNFLINLNTPQDVQKAQALV